MKRLDLDVCKNCNKIRAIVYLFSHSLQSWDFDIRYQKRQMRIEMNIIFDDAEQVSLLEIKCVISTANVTEMVIILEMENLASNRKIK